MSGTKAPPYIELYVIQPYRRSRLRWEERRAPYGAAIRAPSPRLAQRKPIGLDHMVTSYNRSATIRHGFQETGLSADKNPLRAPPASSKPFSMSPRRSEVLGYVVPGTGSPKETCSAAEVDVQRAFSFIASALEHGAPLHIPP